MQISNTLKNYCLSMIIENISSFDSFIVDMLETNQNITDNQRFIALKWWSTKKNSRGNVDPSLWETAEPEYEPLLLAGMQYLFSIKETELTVKQSEYDARLAELAVLLPPQ